MHREQLANTRETTDLIPGELGPTACDTGTQAISEIMQKYRSVIVLVMQTKRKNGLLSSALLVDTRRGKKTY